MAARLEAQDLILPGGFLLLAAAVGLLAGIDPVFAIIAALGLAFMLVVVANLYVGLVLFVALASVADVPSVGGAVTFSKVAGVLLAISWVAVLATRQNGSKAFMAEHSGVSYVLILLLGWIALSQLWAEDSAPTLETLFRLSLNAILFLIIFTAVRTTNQAIGFVAAFVAGASIAALHGLLTVDPAGGDQAARLTGTLVNPNELATILVAALAMALGLAVALRESPLARFAALGAAVFCTAGVFLTGSRGGLVALVVALLAFLLIGSRFRGRALLIALTVIVAGAGYYTYIASPEERERVTSVGSGAGRTDLWEVAWRMVKTEPIRGVGAGNFQTLSPRVLLAEPGAVGTEFILGESPKEVHNTYLEIWAEQGTVGLGLFLFIMGFGLYAAVAAARAFGSGGDWRMEALARALFVALAAVLAANFFGSRYVNKELWLLLGLAPAMWAIARTRYGPEA